MPSARSRARYQRRQRRVYPYHLYGDIVSPLDINGAQLWLDSEHVSGYGIAVPADGTAVSTWTDRSGLGRHATQTDGAKQPRIFTKRNLLTANQASLETDTTGWQAEFQCTIARSTLQALYGTASLAVTATANGSMFARTLTGTSAVPVTEGKTYTGLCSWRAATSGRNCGIRIRFYDAAGAVVGGSTNSAGVTNTTTGWTQVSATATAPAGAVYMHIAPWVTDAGLTIGEIHYLDGASIHEGTSTVYRHPTSITKPVLQFDGVDDTMTFASRIDPVNGFTVFAVALTTADNFGRIISTINSGTFSGWQLQIDPGTDDWLVNYGNGTSLHNAKGGVRALNTPYVISAGWDLANIAVYENGVQGEKNSATSSFSTPTSTMNLGLAGNGTGTPWNGHIAEVIVYDRALDDTERKKVEKYLGTKYGIAVA